MKIYFTLKSIPELSDLSRKERRRLWSRHAYKSFRHWQTWIGFFTYLVIIIIGFIISLQVQPWFFYGYAILGVAGGFGVLICMQFMIPTIRRYLAEERNKDQIPKI